MKYLVGLALALSAPGIAATGESVYTSVATEDCITIESSDLLPEPEIDFYRGECPGFGGYQVIVSGGDLRYSVDLKYQGAEVPALAQPRQAFHSPGSSKIEWRFERIGDHFNKDIVLKALIFRINWTDYSEDEMVNRSSLHVVKLDGLTSCTVAQLTDESNMNEKARSIADHVEDYSCLQHQSS